MPLIKDQLQQVFLPDCLTNRELHEQLVSEGLLAQALANLEKPILSQVINILRCPELQEEIIDGKVTLAMIKPDLIESTPINNGTNQLTENEQSELIINEIKPPLEAIFKIVLTLDEKFLNKWCSTASKERQLKIPAMDPERYGKYFQNRLEEFTVLMTEHGPVTFIILYNPDGNAVEEWRNQIGITWDVKKLKIEYPESLRAIFSRDNHNNIFHGSGSPEEVTAEVSLVAYLIERNLLAESH